MENQIFTHLTGAALEEHLNANCIKTEEKDLPKHFTPEELVQYRDDYMKNAFVMRTAIAELNAAKKKYTEATKEPEAQNKKLIIHLQEKQMVVAQQVYLFPDDECRMMGYYDNTGMLVDARLCTAEEKQLYINRNA